MTTFPQNSPWHLYDQLSEATRKAQEEALLRHPEPSPRPDLGPRIRSWAADLNDALNDVTGIYATSGKTAGTAYAEGLQRIDEIIREMEEVANERPNS